VREGIEFLQEVRCVRGAVWGLIVADHRLYSI
jgi:hypothetical protein